MLSYALGGLIVTTFVAMALFIPGNWFIRIIVAVGSLIPGYLFYFLGTTSLRLIEFEEEIFEKYGEKGLQELRQNSQVFNWRKPKKNTQPVAGGDTAR